MRTNLETRIDRLTMPRLLMAAVAWVLLFAAFYAIVPLLDSDSVLLDSSKSRVSGLLNAIYYSVVTATTLGYGDITPTGWLRGVSALEVLGGILLAGLVINKMVALPSRQTRNAVNACTGWWLERIALPDDRVFFSFSWMLRDGKTLKKGGFNHDPDGPMNKTTFNGQVITEYFPVLLSLYENCVLSTDYSEGVYRFEMILDSRGQYREYNGSCYDKQHGRRDRIVARRIDDPRVVRKLEQGALTDNEMADIEERLFGQSAAWISHVGRGLDPTCA